MSRADFTPQRKWVGFFAGLFLLFTGAAYADGDETLGPPSIPIASGSGLVANGIGLLSQPGTFSLEVPANATVRQVLLYWEGFSTSGQGAPTITINGITVTGTLIGGPDVFPVYGYESYTYRADITSLNIVAAGSNMLTVTNLNFPFIGVPNGAGVLAIFEDGSGDAGIQLVDGDDIAFRNFAPPADATVPQTFTFPSAPFDRPASITSFFGSVTGPASRFGPIRPHTIRVTTGASVQEVFDVLASTNGDEWDTYKFDFVIPAGATSVTIEVISEDRFNTGLRPASLVWVASGLQIPPPTQPQPASLGDRVWEDLDADGIQDCTDANMNGIVGDMGDTGPECGTGVAGVPVQLLAPIGNSCVGATSVIASTTTNGMGFYQFTGLTPGSYCVSFDKPPNFDCTLPNVNDGTPAGAALDSDGVDNGMGSCPVGDLITLDPGENDPTWDLGLVPVPPQPASLGDRVWEDLDGDGVQNCTDSNNNDIIGDAGDMGAECGTGVSGVLVSLLQPVNNSCAGASAVIATATTNADGFYGFTNLAPGDYCVSFDKPAGFECTLPNVNDGTPAGAAADSDGVDNGMGACPVGDLITLDPGENDPTWDLGVVQPRLGDRVWEDLDGDGTQDCTDTNGNGIIGDAGDNGPECGTGVDNVTVNLFTSTDDVCGNNDDAMIAMTTTANGGFYGFDGVDGVTSGTFCVSFDTSTVPANFCDTTVDGITYSLGAPVFTARNQGADDSDSDADPATGLSEAATLSAPGDVIDLTIDAGIYCPAKIGDLVFSDDDGDGIQDPGESGVDGVKVTLFECGVDMMAGTADDVAVGEMRTTEMGGMYMFGAETNYSLPPGKYFVQFDETTFPAGTTFTTPNQGNDPALDSDCLPPGGITSCTDLTTSRAIDLSRDCGLVPPPPPTCDLILDKSCRVEPLPAPPATDKCNGKLQQFTVKWNGSETITVSGLPNDATGPISKGDEVTFFGPFDQNDVFVNIAGSSAGTQSVFHMSCSDEDFNDPSDCGKPAGDGKGNDASKVNDWLLEGFIDNDGFVLDCTADPSSATFSDNCSFIAQPLPSCDNGPKPEFLTWRYDGGTGGDGDCADSTFATIVNADGKLHTDFVCAGQVDTSLPVTVVDDNGNVYTVNPGDSFTTERDWSKTISLTDSNGNVQNLEFHTSCSQPLEAQATGGALTLAALDNRTGGRDVTYRYEVMNNGDPLTNVGIEDDKLGTIASGLGLPTGGSATFDVTTLLLGSTTNTATATGFLPDGSACSPGTATDTVNVEAVIPPCSFNVVLYKVEDDKLKLKITNTDVQDRVITVESLTVDYPAARENLKEVKLDGGIYKASDSANPILGTPATIGPNDWTEADVSKRQLDPGEERTLEIVTTKKSDKNGRFEVTITFAEGCSTTVIVENQAVQ